MAHYYKVTYTNKHRYKHTDFIKANSFEAAKAYADGVTEFFNAQHDGLVECSVKELKNGSGFSIINLLAEFWDKSNEKEE